MTHYNLEKNSKLPHTTLKANSITKQGIVNLLRSGCKIDSLLAIQNEVQIRLTTKDAFINMGGFCPLPTKATKLKSPKPKTMFMSFYGNEVFCPDCKLENVKPYAVTRIRELSSKYLNGKYLSCTICNKIYEVVT